MIGPDQDLNDFPRWIWPYINIARIAEIARLKNVRQIEDMNARVPAVAINAHMMAIISALTLRKAAASMDGELGKQFSVAASRALSVAIDDCGSTGQKPWPIPPKAIFLREIAGQLAMAAAELEGDEVLHSGLKEAMSEILMRADKG
ncbi:MAG TPA: hypothetical protein VM869_11225 [Enhygromyxa sp.]|nr:hypothetical protein [Enhygromyxa sp.]